MAMFHYGSLANGLELPYAYLTIFTASGYFCTFLPEDYIVIITCWFPCTIKVSLPHYITFNKSSDVCAR